MIYDLAVIGGGINGVGIAADAAGRGLSVLLAEMGDLASGTSSHSSKLVHGGLRYLEYFEFRQVRKALQEREVLLAKAPHIIWPQRFVLPQVPGGRPWLLLRAGLFLYDHLGHRQRMPGSRSVDLRHDAAGGPLRCDLTSGFTYWDCHVDDARLVVLNAGAAAQKGAVIETRTRVEAMIADGALWHLTLKGRAGNRAVRARALVNAAGPWVQDVEHR
ncbi:MAG: FAD-dependent oxidoreductase, partial [Hyphomicrobium sp.]